MIAGMPRPRPPHLHREVTRHGTVVWYVRRAKGPRIRLREKYGTPDFMAEYEAALAGKKIKRKRPERDTLAWLIERYRDSKAWAKLAPRTRMTRESIARGVISKSGHEAYTDIDSTDIVMALDNRTDAMGTEFLKFMSGLFKWAISAGLAKINPTVGVERPPRATDGHHTWTREEVEAFEARWPLGTRERVALAVLMYTGLRRGDAITLGRQHVRDGVFTIKTEKTGVEIIAPILPVLQRAIGACPPRGLTFIETEAGQPYSRSGFSYWFREACKAAGVPGTAHGLRKAGAARAAERGASEKHLNAIFGWEGSQMASLYTKKADRVRLAKDAIRFLDENDPETSIPAPSHQVRGAEPK